MSKRPVGDISGVPRTMLAPLWARAIETTRRDPILSDWSAVTTVASIDYDFERLRVPRVTQVGCCVRSSLIDTMVRDVLRAEPHATLVNIGEGLDNRFGRVDNGVLSCWDVDLPEVTALRERFYPPDKRRGMIACSVLDTAWMDQVAASRQESLLLVAEGVLMYLPPDAVRTLFERVANRWPGAGFIFDSTIPALLRFGSRIELGTEFNAPFRWAIRDSAEIERWGPGYELRERRSIFQVYRERYGWFLRAFTRVVPGGRRLHSVNHFRLGVK